MLCLYLCGDLWVISFLSLFPLVTAHALCPIARRDGVEQCFLCLPVFIPYPIMTPHTRLALSCSALPPICFPFIGSVPFPSPLSLLHHSSDLLLPRWSRSDRGRRERRRKQECQTLFSAYALGLSLPTLFFFFFLLLLFLRFSIVAVYGKRWQSMGSNSEVRTFDRCLLNLPIDLLLTVRQPALTSLNSSTPHHTILVYL